MAGPVRVAGPVVGRRAGYALVGQHGGNLLVAGAGEVHGEDAAHDRRGLGVGLELVQPGTGCRLGRVGVGPLVGDPVAVGDWLSSIDFSEIPVQHKSAKQALTDVLSNMEWNLDADVQG